MSADSFSFKQFDISQDRTAMKVGTDGVLLGAWATGGMRILDVGTGTGLIALMMAQRCPNAQVVGIDIDAEACKQARENVERSKFADRIEIQNVALQDFECTSPFDAIVSNPPFFTDSMRAPDERRSQARHTDTLPFNQLMRTASRLLADNGVLSIVVPAEISGTVTGEAAFAGLFLQRRVMVKTTPRKPAKRCLLSFGKHTADKVETAEECLLKPDGGRSEWYDNLTDGFYMV